MWWEPRTATEADLINEVRRLHALYRERLGSTPDPWVIRGIGAGPAITAPPGAPRLPVLAHDWHPLILIDDRSAGVLPAAARFNFEELDKDSAAAQVLYNWQVRSDTLVEPVGPVIPAVRPGDVYSGAGTATVGLPVATNSWSVGAPGFLTVAHGVGAVGSAVTLSAGAVSARVNFRDESARGQAGGDDIALVVLDPPHQLSGWLVNQGPLPPPGGPPYARAAVDLYGGMSGTVQAQVNGAILQMGDETWQWLDCWELGVTQPLMQRGDSGSLAIDPTANPQIFGHFVGGAVALRGTGFTHHWVQDLGQVLNRQPMLTSMISF
jgi:hypothetical protein